MDMDTEIKIKLPASKIPTGSVIETKDGPRYILLRDPEYPNLHENGKITTDGDCLTGVWLSCHADEDAEWDLVKVNGDIQLTWCTTLREFRQLIDDEDDEAA